MMLLEEFCCHSSTNNPSCHVCPQPQPQPRPGCRWLCSFVKFLGATSMRDQSSYDPVRHVNCGHMTALVSAVLASTLNNINRHNWLWCDRGHQPRHPLWSHRRHPTKVCRGYLGLPNLRGWPNISNEQNANLLPEIADVYIKWIYINGCIWSKRVIVCFCFNYFRPFYHHHTNRLLRKPLKHDS